MKSPLDVAYAKYQSAFDLPPNVGRRDAFFAGWNAATDLLADQVGRHTLEAALEEAAGESPEIGTREVCRKCGHEIEWTGTDWRDRGNGTRCLPPGGFDQDGKPTRTPRGKHHQ